MHYPAMFLNWVIDSAINNMTSIFKANAIVKKMPKANTYTHQRVLSFFNGYDNLSDTEKQQIRRIIEKATKELLDRL